MHHPALLNRHAREARMRRRKITCERQIEGVRERVRETMRKKGSKFRERQKRGKRERGR